VIAEYHNCDAEDADMDIQAGLDAIARFNEMNELFLEALAWEQSVLNEVGDRLKALESKIKEA
jgi:hypothetical protein